MASTSRHVYHLKAAEPFYASKLGSIQRCTVDQLPILRNLSLKRLVLGTKAIREPHWHANANELTYCISGRSLVSVLDTGSKFTSFIVEAGDMFHIDSGSLHHTENLSDTESAEFMVCFRHEKPEDFAPGAALGAMSPSVLGNTYNLPSAALSKIKWSTFEKHIVEREGAPTIPSTAHHPDPHKFSIEEMEPPLKANGAGYVKPARAQFWPTLRNMSMYSLTVEESGMREPHWHPITSEMGGATDTYTLGAGDMYYTPAAYPHQIEVLSESTGPIHFCIFFDQPAPLDVGYKASAEAMPHEVMAATLGVGLDRMPGLEGAAVDPLIVKRVNDVDEVAQYTE